jgi:hypothetical protein
MRNEQSHRAAVVRDGIGVPGAQHVAVTRFSGPAFVRPNRVGGLSAHWRGATLRVSWRRARNAARYIVTLREHRGALLRFTTRSDRFRVTAADPTFAGVVLVMGVSADGSRGAAVTVRYRAERKPANRFLPFSQLRQRVKRR